MKKLLLIFIVSLSLSVHAKEPSVDLLGSNVYTVSSDQISTYYCTNSNVFIIETCVKEFNLCINKYMTRITHVEEGSKLMNAITYCVDSIGL